MAEVGKYLYCIIPCQENRAFDEGAIGNEGGGVYTVCHRGLGAVVSDSSLTQYESTRRNMMAHEKVGERIMREFTLLPVRFGTVADSPTPIASIQKLLESRCGEFQRLLEEMEGKVELGVKAYWLDEKAVFEELVAENGEIRRIRDSLSGKPPAATYFDRMRLGERVREALSRKKAKEAAKILLPLRRIASEVRENDVLLDRMIVNAAFLVDRVRESEFDRAMSQMDEELGGGIAIRYIGPAPPYNFVNIVVNWRELG